MKGPKINDNGSILQRMCRMKPGEEYSLTWRWREDGDRNHWKRAAKKGYFKKRSARGIDTFIRTSKQYIEGDSLKLPIAYSWPDPSKAPRHIRALLTPINEAHAHLITKPE